MRSFLANALVTAGLLLPLCLNAQPRGSSRPSFSGSGGSFRGGIAAPRAHAITRQARSATYGANYKLTIPPVRGSSLINPGEASCTLNPSYSGSPYCRQFNPRGANYGIEPVYPFWMPSGQVESDEAPAPPVAAAPTDPQLADQVGNWRRRWRCCARSRRSGIIAALRPPGGRTSAASDRPCLPRWPPGGSA